MTSDKQRQRICFTVSITKIEFSKNDLEFGRNLWTAYKNNDLTTLETLAETPSRCSPYLDEVCKAHIDRHVVINGRNRPEKVMEDIVKNTSTDFNAVFGEFVRREGIYGFGDLQIKKLDDKTMNNR